MLAEFSVELGPEDDRLEVPWASADGRLRFYDLKAQPELLLEIRETGNNLELGEFLTAVNAPHSNMQTAKCDTWLSNEITEEEEVFQAAWKFGSYVDVFFMDRSAQLSFTHHEDLAKQLSRLLRKAPEISASAEVAVRRCYFHPPEAGAKDHSGYCLTVYVLGYGDDEEDARRRWNVAIKLMQNALMQAASAQQRKG